MRNVMIVLTPKPCPCRGFALCLVVRPEFKAMMDGLIETDHSDPEWLLMAAEGMIAFHKEKFKS